MSSQALQNELNDSINEYNYWGNQFQADYATTQETLQTMSSMSDCFSAMILVIMDVLPDCINQVGDLLGQTSGQIDIMSSLSSFVSAMESYFGEGANITIDQATDYQSDMATLYTDLGGTGTTTGDQNPPTTPSWISKDDQVELLGYLDQISGAYLSENGVPAGPNTTPLNLNATQIQIAQGNWYNQSINTNGDPQEDGNYNTVNMGYQQMNTKLTSLNQSLTTQQNMWSNELNEYQGTDTDAQQYFNTVDQNSVNNEIPK